MKYKLKYYEQTNSIIHHNYLTKIVDGQPNAWLSNKQNSLNMRLNTVRYFTIMSKNMYTSANKDCFFIESIN